MPSRLLSPWFQGLSEGGKTAYIEAASQQRFRDPDDPPLYQILPDRIELHAAWLRYLQSCIGVIQPWTNWHWLVWLQFRNPSVPEIAEKLGPPPATRRSLTVQRNLWNVAIEAEQFECIYSGRALDPKFDLDHFIPRSFIGHDQPWNLVPTPVESKLNQVKGDKLPDRSFLQKLSKIHSQAIAIWDRIDPPGWRSAKDQYALALRVESRALGDPRALMSAYQATLSPLMDIASRMGFPESWSPR